MNASFLKKTFVCFLIIANLLVISYEKTLAIGPIIGGIVAGGVLIIIDKTVDTLSWTELTTTCYTEIYKLYPTQDGRLEAKSVTVKGTQKTCIQFIFAGFCDATGCEPNAY